MEKQLYSYKALITAVYDGDTVTAEIDLGFKIIFTEKIRLLGINAPEVSGKEKPKGIRSRDALRELILNKEVFVKTEKDRKEKYGRYLGTLFVSKQNQLINVNEWLVKNSFAKEVKY